jgi:hypothetical protein
MLSVGCTSHLKEAKWFYSEAQRLDRAYRTEGALAAYRKARSEAAAELEKRPSAQAFMLKGLAELKLELWEEAEESFLSAFDYGFEQGEEWARQLSLLGMAATLQEMGLEQAALTIYLQLLDRSRLPAVTGLAAQRYADTVLGQALALDSEERERRLLRLLRTAERLTEKDPACGYCHYLEAQILSHLGELASGFEHAAMARELGLPSASLSRDNDNLMVFFYRRYRDAPPSADRERFLALYLDWIARWGWTDPETPEWMQR